MNELQKIVSNEVDSCIGRPSVTVLEDDHGLSTIITESLFRMGYEVKVASSISDAQTLIEDCPTEVYVLDLNLPDGSSLELIPKILPISNVGIIMISGCDDLVDRVVALELGADDYLIKPFNLRELMARVKSVHRRFGRNLVATNFSTRGFENNNRDDVHPAMDFSFDNYSVSIGSRELMDVNGKEIYLTTLEFDLLVVLLQRRGRVLSRNQIMDAIKGKDWFAYDRAVDGLVCRLRKKIPPERGGSHYIKTVIGTGYIFRA